MSLLRSARTLTVCVVLLPGLLPAQVQPNSAAAGLLVNGREAPGFDGSAPLFVADGAVLQWDLVGPPGVPFAVGAGDGIEPGIPSSGGLLNLDPTTVTVPVNGGLDPLFTTNVLGQFTAFSTASFPPGTEISVQAGVPVPTGAVLTAPARLVFVPGDPIPFTFDVSLPELPFPAGNRHVGIGDVDNDGVLDLANSAGIWKGDGQLGYGYLSLDPGGVEAALVDIVGGPDVDLVVLDEVFMGLKLFPGDGTGRFLAATPVQLPVLCGDDGDIRLVDLDGDADRDIVVATGDTSSPGLVRFLNFGNDQFFVTGTFYDDAFCVEAADLDGDGLVDLVVGGLDLSGPTEETRILWGSSGAPHGLANSTVVTSLPEAGSRWLRARDMDGDTDLDLLWAGTSAQGVLVNDGSGGFTFSAAPGAPTPGNWLPRLDAADMDQDGDPDLVWLDRSFADPYVVVSPNDGAAGFASTWYLPLASTSNPLTGHAVPADLDGDGDPDLVCGGTPGTVVANEN